MGLDLRSVELFARVARLGALGRAGEEFQLSPTATTQRIQALEASLGVKLLTRTTRSVTLTPDGEVFLEHARRILDSVEIAVTSVSKSGGKAAGDLRVTAPITFGRSQIVPHVQEFLACHPGVRLSLDLSDRLIDMAEHRYDLAIRVGVLNSSTLLARRMGDAPRMLVATPEYLRRTGAPRVAQDLKQHQCILTGEDQSWRLRDRQGTLHEIRIDGPFTTNMRDTACEVVHQSAGIGLHAVWDVEHHLKAGRLLPVLPTYRIEPEWKIWAVRPPGSAAPTRVEAFLKFLDAKLTRAKLDELV